MIQYEKHHSTSIDYLYRQYDENLVFSSHFHNAFELVYVYEGEITVSLDKSTYLLKVGETLLILPNQIHSYVTKDYSKTFILIFPNNYIAKFYNYSLHYASNHPVLNLEYKYIETLEHEDNQYLLKSVLYYIVYQYTQNEMNKRNDKNINILTNIISYIEENYSKDITLYSMSKQLGYNYNYLSNVINTGLNMNFLSFLNEYRINKACEIMNDSKISSISNLAEACGYISLRTFNRNFIKLKGITPTEYLNKISH